eukprot:236044-Hanusia_phi.AAC.2
MKECRAILIEELGHGSLDEEQCRHPLAALDDQGRGGGKQITASSTSMTSGCACPRVSKNLARQTHVLQANRAAVHLRRRFLPLPSALFLSLLNISTHESAHDPRQVNLNVTYKACSIASEYSCCMGKD